MDEKRTLGGQFLYVSAMLQRVGSFGGHFGGGPQSGQGRVLAILKMKPEITQKELGYLLDMRNQSLGELLSKLEKRGYITRTKSEEDKRTTNVRLTEAGEKAAKDTKRRQGEWEELFDALSPEEQTQLYALLEKLGDGLAEKAAAYNSGREGFGWGGGPPHGDGPLFDPRHDPRHDGHHRGGMHFGGMHHPGCPPPPADDGNPEE